MDKKNDFIGMIDRYVYDVTRRLPKAQREDIDAELRGLIEDMLEQKSPNPTKQDLEEVLIELGRPSTLAAKYRGSKRVLIGSELFDIYFLILKIVVGATAFGITIALIVNLLVSTPESFWITLSSYFASVLSGAVQAFAYVTIIFAVIERFATKKEDWGRENWKPSDLPEVPKSKAKIGYGDAIAGIVFTVIVLLILNIAPEVIGIYIVGDSVRIIPIFNLEVFSSMLILIDIMLALSIVKEAFKIISGKNTLQLATVTTVINVASIVLVIIVFLPPTIWNQDLISTLSANADMSWAESSKLEYWWSLIPKIIVGLTIFGKVVEIITRFVNGARNSIRS